VLDAFADHHALVLIHRWLELDDHPAGLDAQAEALGLLVPPTFDGQREMRCGAVVQRHGEALVLDKDLVGQLRLGPLGEVGHRGHPWQRRRLGDHLTVVPHLEAVQAVEVDVGQRPEPRSQEADRASGDDGDARDRGGQILEHAQHRGHGLRRVGIVGDGREHAVEIEEECGVLDTPGGESQRLGGTQRMGGTRGVGHGPQRTRQRSCRTATNRRSAPPGAYSPYAKIFRCSGRRGAGLCTTAYRRCPLAF
jgi:hypothetical protein